MDVHSVKRDQPGTRLDNQAERWTWKVIGSRWEQKKVMAMHWVKRDQTVTGPDNQANRQTWKVIGPPLGNEKKSWPCIGSRETRLDNEAKRRTWKVIGSPLGTKKKSHGHAFGQERDWTG